MTVTVLQEVVFSEQPLKVSFGRLVGEESPTGRAAAGCSGAERRRGGPPGII